MSKPSSQPPPSHARKTPMPNQEEPGEADRAAVSCQLSEKRMYMARVPCVTRPNDVPVSDRKKQTPRNRPMCRV